MNDLTRFDNLPSPSHGGGGPDNRASGQGLIDVLDRVLDKGVVIAGDVKINLLDIELLTIKIRLLIASADKAREMGIDWWAHDPQLSSKAQSDKARLDADKENKALRERVERLEAQLKALAHNGETGSPSRGAERAPGRHR
jgi:hypothetical protein